MSTKPLISKFSIPKQANGTNTTVLKDSDMVVGSIKNHYMFMVVLS